MRTHLIVLSLALLIASGGWCGKALQAQTTSHPQTQATPSTQQQDMPGMDMSHMDMGHAAENNTPDDGNAPDNNKRVQTDAMTSMHMDHHMDGPHMRMTPPRKATPADWTKAEDIAKTLRSSIERYKDYRLALADGYRIFAPNVPQPEYHFTNYWNGFLEGFTFDPARPTSLLYKKTPTGWQLVGAMYTAARGASLDQLNERVPLGVARWHAHINLCMPKRGEGVHADWHRFGLTGSLATAEECEEAGGRFYPQVFGWMVHVYPFEATPAKMFAQ